jgi:small conductance mechanosensitive channel
MHDPIRACFVTLVAIFPVGATMNEFLADLGVDHLPGLAAHYGIRIAGALLMLLVGFWLAARLANASRRALERGKVDPTLIGFLRNLFYGVMIALVIVQVLSFAHVPTASLVAALGAAGLAIGLSLQNSLSNLAWGVLLILFRPFRVGDYVLVGGLEGTVESINLRHTFLVLPDNREAVIPNAKVGADAIVNYNRRGTRRFEIKVGIGYDDDIGRAMDVVHELFAADPRILKDPAPGVWTAALGDSSVNLVIRGWTRTSDMWETQTALLRQVKEHFDAASISIPFPQHEVRVIGPDRPSGA